MAHELAQSAVDNPVFLAIHLPTAAGAMISLGMAAEVERLARLAKPLSDWMAVQIGGVQALIDESRGDYEAALALYRSIIETGVLLEQRFWVTVARIGAGRCLLALGRDEEAMGELGEAVSSAKAMGATRLLDEIDALPGCRRSRVRAADGPTLA